MKVSSISWKLSFLFFLKYAIVSIMENSCFLPLLIRSFLRFCMPMTTSDLFIELFKLMNSSILCRIDSSAFVTEKVPRLYLVSMRSAATKKNDFWP